MTKYAQGTQVDTGRSRLEIEHTLERFGATGQAWMRDDEQHRVVVAFKRSGRTYRFTLNIPGVEEFRETPKGVYTRTDKVMHEAHDAEIRRRFRSLANYIKAMLDAIDTGIIEADAVLLPFLLLPSGATVYEEAQEQLRVLGTVDLSRALTAGQP